MVQKRIKLLISLCSIFFFLACNKHNDKNSDLELVILTKEMKYANIFNLPNSNTSYKDTINTFYLTSYKSQKDYDNASNLFKYKIINNSNEKYFVFTNRYHWEQASNEYIVDNISGMFYFLTDSLGKDLKNLSSYNISFDTKDSIYFKKIGSKKRFKESKFKNKYDYSVFGDYKILYPNQEIEVEGYILFPLNKNYMDPFNISNIPYMHNNKEYNFQLLLKLNPNYLRNYLPQELVDSLDRHNIKIFNGNIFSNKIKIKPKK